MNLIIIEGAGKVDTIKKLLGKDYEVFASMGHIRDLPQKETAIDFKNNFEPKYVDLPDKKVIIKEMIQKAKKADKIYLGTDLDREGEAISWHIAHVLNIDVNDKCRLEYNEISKTALLKALENPRAINIDLVNAQQARRVLDRIVGYKLSPFLCKKIKPKLSAGRVQSVTLKLVVDKEREIKAFKPQEYWTLTLNSHKKETKQEQEKIIFKSILSNIGKEKAKINNQDEMTAILNDLKDAKFYVKSIKKGESISRPNAPYITSTMQQDALNKLGFSLKKTTSVAQNLYEGVEIKGEGKTALVTYIRTDSTRVSPEAMDKAKDYIIKEFGKEYCPIKPNIYQSKKGAQDAHEAIRPINIELTPLNIKDKVPTDIYRLYKIVYERFLASQMSNAKFNVVTAEILASQSKDYIFKANGKVLVFAGFMKVYKAYEENEEALEKLPNLTEGDELIIDELKPEQKFTLAPIRYTEASLVKAMEEKGIGRPATYTPTVSTLQNRTYIDKEGKYLIPTELGFKVTDILVDNFTDIMDVSFTAQMENKLDAIEEGGIVWNDVIRKFWEYFQKQLKKAGEVEKLKNEPIKTEEICDKCGKPMVIREGRFGKFLACSNYPNCKNILKNVKIEDDKIIKIEEQKVVESDVKCSKCGSNMVIKHGKYGDFLACPNYPKCKNIMSIQKDEEFLCPKCGKPLVKRFSKSKKMFYGCSGYPDCDYLTWDKPTKLEGE